jgi:hypothetical protein
LNGSRDDRPASPEWRKIEATLDDRYRVLARLRRKHQANLFTPSIIATDVLLEKAQNRLTGRAWLYLSAGLLLFLCATALALSTAALLLAQDGILSFLGLYPVGAAAPAKMDGYEFTLTLVRRLIGGGLVAGAAGFMAALSLGCFKAGTLLFHRRHSLRYIRFLAYQKDGELHNKDLRDVFGVEDTITRTFDHVRSEVLTANLITAVINRFLPDRR